MILSYNKCCIQWKHSQRVKLPQPVKIMHNEIYTYQMLYKINTTFFFLKLINKNTNKI